MPRRAPGDPEPDRPIENGIRDLDERLVLNLGAFTHHHERVTDTAVGLDADHALRAGDPVQEIFRRRHGCSSMSVRKTDRPQWRIATHDLGALLQDRCRVAH